MMVFIALFVELVVQLPENYLKIGRNGVSEKESKLCKRNGYFDQVFSV